MESDNTLAIIAIVLSLIALIGIAYVYVEHAPETTDLSGVESSINTVNNRVTNLGRVIEDIDTDCECDVDEDDIEDLEDDIEDNEDYINDIEDCAITYHNSPHTGDDKHIFIECLYTNL